VVAGDSVLGWGGEQRWEGGVGVEGEGGSRGSAAGGWRSRGGSGVDARIHGESGERVVLGGFGHEGVDRKVRFLVGGWWVVCLGSPVWVMGRFCLTSV